MTETDWRDRAACTDVDPALFFPSPMGYRRAVILAPARAICRACPVQEQCLDDVLRLPATADSTGVVAGLTPREREELRTCGDPTLVPVRDVAILVGGKPNGERARHSDDRRGNGSA